MTTPRSAQPVRLIPRLDVKGPNLVKGIHLEGLRVLGRPERFAEFYYERGADELVYMDVVASLYGRSSLGWIIEATAKRIFIPLTVGGGLRTIDDIHDVLRLGADKVAINTAAVRHPPFVSAAARRFGSSTIVVSIEAMKKPGGTYEAYTDNGRERTGVDAVEWAVRAVELGAGELLVTSIEREGTGNGFDVELVGRISRAVPVPVIASGGAGRVAHVVDAFDGGADAVALASMLHYAPTAADAGRGPAGEVDEGNRQYLERGRAFSKVETADLSEIRMALVREGYLPGRSAGVPA